MLSGNGELRSAFTPVPVEVALDEQWVVAYRRISLNNAGNARTTKGRVILTHCVESRERPCSA